MSLRAIQDGIQRGLNWRYMAFLLLCQLASQVFADAQQPEQQNPSFEDLVSENEPTGLMIKEGFSLEVESVELQAILAFIAEEYDWRLHLDIPQELARQLVSLSVAEDELKQVLAAIPQSESGDLAFGLQPPDLQVYLADGLAPSEVSSENELLNSPETRFYRVHYADALTLQALIQETSGSDGWLSNQGRAQLDERSNTLVVTDVPERLAMIDVLLSELDVPVSQVLVEARIISASLDSARQLGVHWQALSVVSDTSASSGLHLSTGDALQLQGGFTHDRFRLELDLAAMQAAGKVELLARPSIMTRANQQASIQSGVRVPYQSQAGGTAGGSVTQFVDAVLSLTVLPRITPDGQVHMELEVRQDAVAGSSSTAPAINTNTISTQVRLDNRDTLVLGGIFSDQLRENESGVPVLANLPGLGKLFRQTHHSTQRTELLVFITPVIIPAH